MNYFRYGAGAKVLFLPGWGRGNEDFKEVIKKGKVDGLALDLPGFGKTPEQNLLLTPSDYAHFVYQYLANINFAPKVIVGHSFGGKIACLLQQRFPGSHLLLIAPAIVKEQSLKVKWRILSYKALKPLIKLKIIKNKKRGSKDYQNASEHLKKVLVAHLQAPINLELLKGPLTLIWGKDDQATKLKSAKKINKRVKKSKLIVIPGDHFAPLTYHYLLIKEIRRLL